MHRDIKPSNIYIKEDEGKFKLGDFGCAIYIKDNNNESIGTYMYSAPEMVLDLDYDEKIDFWSLGVTLFELYFGILPYSPTANNSVMLNYFNGVYPWSFKKTKDPKDTGKNKCEKRNKEDIIYKI